MCTYVQEYVKQAWPLIGSKPGINRWKLVPGIRQSRPIQLYSPHTKANAPTHVRRERGQSQGSWRVGLLCFHVCLYLRFVYYGPGIPVFWLNINFYFIFICAYPIYYLRPSSSLSPSNFVTQIRGHIAGSSTPPFPLRYVPSFLSRDIFQPCLPSSSTRTELCLPTLQGALENWILFYFYLCIYIKCETGSYHCSCTW